MRLGRFLEFLESPVPRVIILLALTAVFVAVAAYVISSLRRGFRDRGADASDLMTNFRELHNRGELSDEEYRTIKASLAERMRRQLDVEAPKLDIEQPKFDIKEPKLESSGQDTKGDD